MKKRLSGLLISAICASVLNADNMSISIPGMDNRIDSTLEGSTLDLSSLSACPEKKVLAQHVRKEDSIYIKTTTQICKNSDTNIYAETITDKYNIGRVVNKSSFENFVNSYKSKVVGVVDAYDSYTLKKIVRLSDSNIIAYIKETLSNEKEYYIVQDTSK